MSVKLLAISLSLVFSFSGHARTNCLQECLEGGVNCIDGASTSVMAISPLIHMFEKANAIVLPASLSPLCREGSIEVDDSTVTRTASVCQTQAEGQDAFDLRGTFSGALMATLQNNPSNLGTSELRLESGEAVMKMRWHPNGEMDYTYEIRAVSSYEHLNRKFILLETIENETNTVCWNFMY